jgi:hypothetical protein
VLGIDPAFRKGGIGLCLINGLKVTFPKVPTTLAAVDYIRKHAPRCRVVIENSNLQNASFDLSGSKPVVARKSRNVGANQAISQILVEAAQERFADVLELSPKNKGKKWCRTLARSVAASLGHVLPSRMSQDKRDAYQLAVRGISNRHA